MSSSGPLSFRHLTRHDVALMHDLLTTFAEAFDDPATYNSARPSKAYLENLLGGDHFIAIVAAKDGAVVGGLTAYELPKFEQERKEIYIFDLAVAAARRREGIATALIQELKKIAVTRSAYVIFVQADHGDAPAIALYDTLGTKEQVLHFDIAVT